MSSDTIEWRRTADLDYLAYWKANGKLIGRIRMRRNLKYFMQAGRVAANAPWHGPFSTLEKAMKYHAHIVGSRPRSEAPR